MVGSIDQQQLIPKAAAKYLGFWWSWNLSAKTPVDEAVKKARRAFFIFGGMGAFQGDLNPLPYLKRVWFQLFCMAVKIGS